MMVDRLGLRTRLYLASGAILLLFAFNVGTHLWGSYARSESVLAYRDATEATTLVRNIEQGLTTENQRVQVLAALRETNAPIGATQRDQANAELTAISDQLRALGGLSNSDTEAAFRIFYKPASDLLDEWIQFYGNYNDITVSTSLSSNTYEITLESLGALAEQHTTVAMQRSTVIDNTIQLTDRITIIAFISSITITLILIFTLIRSTNASFFRLRVGVEKFGAGDLTHRIDENRDAGEIANLAKTFNEMSASLQTAISDLNVARSDAEAANEAKSMFLANVSHELRTPLNAIIGYSEMLQDELGDGGKINRSQFHHDLTTIIFSGRQLLALINDILDISKIETGKMSVSAEPFNAADLIIQVCDALSPLLAQNNNRLDLDIDGARSAQVESDAAKVQQILTNLFSNACKFTKDGVITVFADIEDGALHLDVTDSGIGMTEEQQAKVFQAFVQADTNTSVNYGGTGLGLAIVRNFCDMLGGEIKLTSEAGKGSKFEVSLPVAPR